LDAGNGRDVINPFDFAAAASEGLVNASKPITATLAANVLFMLILLTAFA
jgi:hypothetical protein